MVDLAQPNIAANLYAQTAKISSPAAEPSKVGQEVKSFSQFMEEGVQDSIDTLKTGETMAARAVTEEADLVEVVQAVNDADLTLKKVVAIRDAIISAFQEVQRMPI